MDRVSVEGVAQRPAAEEARCTIIWNCGTGTARWRRIHHSLYVAVRREKRWFLQDLAMQFHFGNHKTWALRRLKKISGCIS